MTSVVVPTAPARPVWRIAQLIGVLVAVGLIAALWVFPGPTLHLLWDMVIPLLPAVFLVNPLLWRNVCPLATLNDLSGQRPGLPAMGSAMLHWAWVGGIGLLFILVPARRFLFNENGPDLAVTITAVAALAIVSGRFFARRAGFCTSICPVLPVEKLYGQAPLLPMRGARCEVCTVCSPVGCIELAGNKTVAQTIGPLRRDLGWLRTGFGAFAAAFPGFVIGYFTAVDGDLGTAAHAYLRVLGFAALSYVCVAAVTAALRPRLMQALPVLGALALGLYYWYATPALAEAWGRGAGAAPTVVLRSAFGVLLAFWLWRALRPRRT